MAHTMQCDFVQAKVSRIGFQIKMVITDLLHQLIHFLGFWFANQRRRESYDSNVAGSLLFDLFTHASKDMIIYHSKIKLYEGFRKLMFAKLGIQQLSEKLQKNILNSMSMGE